MDKKNTTGAVVVSGLSRGKAGVAEKGSLRATQISPTDAAHFKGPADVIIAGTLTYNGSVKRFSSLIVPGQNCFPLIGDADAAQIFAGNTLFNLEKNWRWIWNVSFSLTYSVAVDNVSG